MKLKTLFFSWVFLLVCHNLSATTKTSVTNGNWNNSATWNPASVPLIDDTIIVIHNLIIDERTEFGANLIWIKSSGSLIGDSAFAVHGNFLNDGFIDINNFILTGDGNSTINNGTIQGKSFIPGNPNNFNTGTISSDSLTFSEEFSNNGIITTEWLISAGIINNNSGATITATNMTVGDYIFHNNVNAVITVTSSLLIGSAFINDGEVSCFDLTQSATISGTNGKFCIANFFKNMQDSILGSIDICDATPGQQPFLDINFGYVANTVSFCAVSPCSTSTSTNELNSGVRINVYPNPSAGMFNIVSANEVTLAEIEIYNVLGEKIFSQIIQYQKTAIDLRKQPYGVYLLQVRTNEGSATKKIIINQ